MVSQQAKKKQREEQTKELLGEPVLEERLLDDREGVGCALVEHCNEPALEERLLGDREGVEAVLQAIEAPHCDRVMEAALHLIRAGGKRLRPLLSCVVLRASGGDPPLWMEYIACSELIHLASLLHDDVVDEAVTRRGQMAAHLAFDSHTAVLAGDFLLAHALDVLARAPSRELLRAASRVVLEMAQGQVMEAEATFQTATPLARLLLLNRLKTAALFAYAAQVGALLAGASSAVSSAVVQFGLGVGEAFQLVDDIFDWQDDEARTGKPAGLDLSEGKITVPLWFALEKEPGLVSRVRRYWESASGSEQREDLWQSIQRRVQESGALSQTRARALALVEGATRALSALPPSPWRDYLHGMAARSVERIA